VPTPTLSDWNFAGSVNPLYLPNVNVVQVMLFSFLIKVGSALAGADGLNGAEPVLNLTPIALNLTPIADEVPEISSISSLPTGSGFPSGVPPFYDRWPAEWVITVLTVLLSILIDRPPLGRPAVSTLPRVFQVGPNLIELAR